MSDSLAVLTRSDIRRLKFINKFLVDVYMGAALSLGVVQNDTSLLAPLP